MSLQIYTLHSPYFVSLFYLLAFRLPGTSLPNFKLASMLMKDALVISIITFSVSVSVAKVIAHQFGYKINSNQVSENTVSSVDFVYF